MGGGGWGALGLIRKLDGKNKPEIPKSFWQYTELFIKGHFTAYFRTLLLQVKFSNKKYILDQCNKTFKLYIGPL